LQNRHNRNGRGSLGHDQGKGEPVRCR